ncbi:hypothetical protein ACOSP7_020936 [Xanthoceras sorbifolium]
MKDLTMGLQTLDAKVKQQIRRIQLPPSPIPLPPPVGQHSQAPLSPNFSEAAPQMKSMRLDVPRFSGANPTAWVSRVQRYFDYYNTPDPQRLIIASFHLDGDALDWFDWMSKNHLIFGWHDFYVLQLQGADVFVLGYASLMPRARVLGLCYYRTVTRLLTLVKN